MPASINCEGIYAKIYRCITSIPEGRVATYGQIAELCGASGARQVGYALSATPVELDIPWHRVINAKGEVSCRSHGAGDRIQLQRLAAEGVVPGRQGRIDLTRYRWQPSPGNLPEDEFDLPGWG